MSVRRVSLSEIAGMPNISSHYKLSQSLRHLECILRRQGLVYKIVYASHSRWLSYYKIRQPKAQFYLVEPTDFIQMPVVELNSDDRWLIAGHFQYVDVDAPNDITPNVTLWHPVITRALPDHG